MFQIFKIGIGPSSSHTMGPMLACHLFIETLKEHSLFDITEEIFVEFYGSLALTGIGHCSDKAVLLGLEGERAESVDPLTMDAKVDFIRENHTLFLAQQKKIYFDPKKHIVFLRKKALALHANGMIFRAKNREEKILLERSYYSVGGGLVKTEEQMQKPGEELQKTVLPFPFFSGDSLLKLAKEHSVSISDMMLANEKVFRSQVQIEAYMDLIWKTMSECIQRGCERSGFLPGKLKVRRRASSIYQELSKNSSVYTDPLTVMDWVNLYALAVNEENASGSKIVTAPTNGASGIIPAVLKYYETFCPGSDNDHKAGIHRFLLTSAAIGCLYAKNASISGAEVGCQGEVGVACSMAAAGLTAALLGTNAQVEQAAEIGMEHNLGLTCDPIGGLVQIPCIERNAMGAIKAINASRIAMRGNGEHYVSLDSVMKTMMQTGADMKTKYKETSRGGLAVNIPEC